MKKHKFESLKKDDRGFTLIELIAVLAILGILVSIAIPKINISRENAEKIALEATLKTLNSAYDMYIIDNSNYTEPENTDDALGKIEDYISNLDEVKEKYNGKIIWDESEKKFKTVE